MEAQFDDEVAGDGRKLRIAQASRQLVKRIAMRTPNFSDPLFPVTLDEVREARLFGLASIMTNPSSIAVSTFRAHLFAMTCESKVLVCGRCPRRLA